MNAPAPQPECRRIVVTLNATLCSRAPLATAVRLAGTLGAGVEGVFIEDINLIQLAGLPFLRELSAWSLAEAAVDSQRMERQLRAMARQARTLLEEEARKLDVPCTFQVWRGRTGAEALTQAFATDILSLGCLSVLASGRLWARAGTRQPLHSADITGIGVLAGLSEAAARALTIAARLAGSLGASLTIFLPERGTDRVLRLEEKIRALLGTLDVPARLVPLGGADIQRLAQAAQAAGSSLLIAEAGQELLQLGGLERLQEALDRPVLLVR
jgi:nucleotide-binding universal stress UspA family protein